MKGCLQPNGSSPSSSPKPHAFLGLISKGKSSQRSGVEAKRDLTGKFILPETCVANRSVELELQQSNTINSSALTPSPAPPQHLPPNHGPAEVTPLPDPAPPASIHGLVLSAPIPPRPVRPTPAPLRPAQPDQASLPPTVPRLYRVTFGPGIAEDLPYATTE